MSPTLSIAASLSSNIRQDIGIQVLSRSQPISHLAATHQVSRKFIYQQGDKAQQALNETFAPSQGDDDVLFHLPVTKSWLYQLILGLVLICHSSYRGVVELFRDLFDTPISIGTIHHRLEAAAVTAAEIDQSQDLSGKAEAKQPKVAKRMTIHVDGLLKERFEAFGNGTHKEKITQLLDVAERNSSLERQLHSSNQRLSLARQHIELLQEKLAGTEIASESKPAPASEPAHTPIPDDWREMSNAELNGSHIPGSADEKIRRSIAAVQDFNAGLDKEDQWSITPTTLKKLSGSNGNRVKDYLGRHPETAQMLEQYNSGFGYHQNRYRGDPRDAMRWPLVYGEYEW